MVWTWEDCRRGDAIDALLFGRGVLEAGSKEDTDRRCCGFAAAADTANDLGEAYEADDF